LADRLHTAGTSSSVRSSSSFLAYVAKRVIVAREARHMRLDDEAPGTKRTDRMGD
jgi:hypothetical protein